MSHRASAKKTLRQSKVHRLRNKSVKSRLTTETRTFEHAVERGDAQAARGQLGLLTKLLHQAAADGTIKANTAARRQTRFQNQLNKLGTADA